MPEQTGHTATASSVTFGARCGLACTGPVVRRGLKFAVVVGTVLIAINHGDAILAGELTRTNYLKMALTVVVPYVVSVLSSVGAMTQRRQGSR
jgi:hypothetical protein